MSSHKLRAIAKQIEETFGEYDVDRDHMLELSTPQGGTTNKVAKVNSYGSFGLGVELGTWR